MPPSCRTGIAPNDATASEPTAAAADPDAGKDLQALRCHRDRRTPSTSTSPQARRSAFWGRTAPARPRCSASSAAPSRRIPAACCLTAAISPARRRRGAASWGSRRSFQIPQPFGGMTRVREPGGRGSFRRRRSRARRLCALHRYPRAVRPCRQGQPPAGATHPARPQAPRTRARAGDRSAGAAARRGRRRPDRARMPGAGRADHRGPAPRASRSSGSSTSCTPWWRWSTGSWCCTAAVHRGRAPHEVIRSPAVAEIYMGIEADA